MVSENYRFLIDTYGTPTNAIPADPGVLALLDGRLPPELLDFWRACGWGQWWKGKFQFCNPLACTDIVALLLKGDPQFDPARTWLYGYGAFAELWLWNEDHGRIEIYLPRLEATAMVTDPEERETPPDLAVYIPLTRLDSDTTADLREDSDAAKPLFSRVLKALGPLGMGECYGFVPALQLGGEAHVENARKQDAMAHFALLGQLGPISLYDYSDGERFVRELGSD